MPYIHKERRNDLVPDPLDNSATTGELNFQITAVVKRYLDLKGTNYKTINDIIGALEGAKLEFYRRVAVPYEDTKIIENGDVY